MSLTDQDQELFEAYHHGSLSGEALTSFEERLQADKDFATSYLAYKQAVKSLKLSAFGDVVSEVMQEQPTPQSSPKNQWLKIAAAVLILITGTIAIVSLTGDEEVTFAALYRPYPNILQDRASTASTLDNALAAYQTGDYEKAAVLLEQIRQPSDTVHFYKGMSYLSQGAFDNGISSFTSIDSSNTIFTQQLNWYLAISYIGKRQPEKAIRQLEMIKAGEYNYQKAQEVLALLR